MIQQFRRACLLASGLSIPLLMLAQIDRTKAPAPAAPPQVRVGETKKGTLPNGMKVIVVENHKLPMVSLQVRFDHPPILQGSIAGYQDLMGELLTAGTARRTKQELDEAVDKLGAQLNGANDGLFASSLKRNFPELMRYVYEVVASPAFNAAEFEKARTRYASGLQMRPEDPDQVAEVVARALTYSKKHPYGEVPTETTVAKITRVNLVAYYERFFRPEQGYLVFVGDISEEEAMRTANEWFGTWKGATVESTTDAKGVENVKNLGPVAEAAIQPAANQPRQVCFVDRPGSAQSVIKVVFPVDLKPTDPDALSAQVLNTILGGGVFNARLMQNLREKNAFTYGAYSSIEPDRWCGSFSAGCSVRNAVTDSAVTEIMREIEGMLEAPVTQEELDLAKSFMAGSFARSLEDPRTIARFALNTQILGLDPQHYATYLQRLDTVSAATVHAAAKRFLKPDHATILVVGDKQEVANTLVGHSANKAVIYYDANGDLYRESFEMPAAGQTAQSVLEAYITAIGGAEKIGKLKALKKVYATEMGGMAVDLTEQFAVPRKYMMTMTSGPMVLQKIVYDGTRGKKTGMDGEDDLVDLELEDARQNAFPFPEASYRELDYGALLNGVVEVDGRKCDRLMVKKAAGGFFTAYFDQQTGLKVRHVEPKATEQGTMQVTTDFKDYKAVDGILFPHTIEQNVGVKMTFTAKVIEVNKPMDESVFSITE
jgi:zinc protease